MINKSGLQQRMLYPKFKDKILPKIKNCKRETGVKRGSLAKLGGRKVFEKRLKIHKKLQKNTNGSTNSPQEAQKHTLFMQKFTKISKK